MRETCLNTRIFKLATTYSPALPTARGSLGCLASVSPAAPWNGSASRGERVVRTQRYLVRVWIFSKNAARLTRLRRGKGWKPFRSRYLRCFRVVRTVARLIRDRNTSDHSAGLTGHGVLCFERTARHLLRPFGSCKDLSEKNLAAVPGGSRWLPVLQRTPSTYAVFVPND